MGADSGLDPELLAVRIGVLLKHPSLVLSLLGGEVRTSKQHILIELRRAKRLYDECQGDTQDLFSLAKVFKERLCYGNSYLYAVCCAFTPASSLRQE